MPKITYCPPAIAEGAAFNSSFTRKAIIRQIRQWKAK